MPQRKRTTKEHLKKRPGDENVSAGFEFSKMEMAAQNRAR